MMKSMQFVKRGEIYYADLDPVRGSEQGGMRPVLIIQNDLGNRFSPTVIVLPLTSRMNKAPLRTHVTVHPPMGGLQKSSVILCEQVRTLEKKRLCRYVGVLRPDKMRQVEQALLIAVGGIDKGESAPYNKEESERNGVNAEKTEKEQIEHEGTVEK